ncbi:hypothetical protein [Nocardioides sp.]|uniref:hypothetical protein n=1 Tax=Nocardioides sp. TaxID=35761 RepID=UPI002C710969|nr:hypothetical protein [Nocardioides sp.]HSX67225.1 hypothetical protein [Nocardioides sp.]
MTLHPLLDQRDAAAWRFGMNHPESYRQALRAILDRTSSGEVVVIDVATAHVLLLDNVWSPCTRLGASIDAALRRGVRVIFTGDRQTLSTWVRRFEGAEAPAGRRHLWLVK